MSTLAVAVLLSLSVRAAAQPTARCAPPYDDVISCPERYRPKPTSASKKDKDDINKWLLKVRTAEAAEKTAYDVVETARKAANAANSSSAKVETYLKELKNAKIATDTKYLLANETIQRVNAAYGLTPPVKDFTQDARLLNANRAILPWRTKYSEQERYDSQERRWKRLSSESLQQEAVNNSVLVDGKSVSLGVAAGTTFPNGRISLYSVLFEFQNPAPYKSGSDLTIPVPMPGAGSSKKGSWH
mgnify:FL=1